MVMCMYLGDHVCTVGMYMYVQHVCTVCMYVCMYVTLCLCLYDMHGYLKVCCITLCVMILPAVGVLFSQVILGLA